MVCVCISKYKKCWKHDQFLKKHKEKQFENPKKKGFEKRRVIERRVEKQENKQGSAVDGRCTFES